MIELYTLRTRLQRGNSKETEHKRLLRIEEALEYEAGTKDFPRKHIVAMLPDGREVYFKKPGKEAFNTRRINENDMTPLVGDGGQKPDFQLIWACLIRISSIDVDIFTRVCILIYRIGYLLDHTQNELGQVRYSPREDVWNEIEKMDLSINEVMPYKSLFAFLYFIDMLCWNEDVKYHVEYGRANLRGRKDFKAGSINTALSCITVANLVRRFCEEIKKTKDDRVYDPIPILDGMQRFSRSRGVCIPKNAELLDWLAPYIYKT